MLKPASRAVTVPAEKKGVLPRSAFDRPGRGLLAVPFSFSKSSVGTGISCGSKTSSKGNVLEGS